MAPRTRPFPLVPVALGAFLAVVVAVGALFLLGASDDPAAAVRGPSADRRVTSVPVAVEVPSPSTAMTTGEVREQPAAAPSEVPAAGGAALTADEPRRARGAVLIDDGDAPRSPGTKGVLAKEDVQAGVAAVKEQVKGCYEGALKIDEALAGTVKVSFTLEGNDEGKGVVTRGEIAESDMNSPFFEACVLQEIARAEFKAPGGGGVVEVTYPFRFANVEEPPPGPAAASQP